MVAEAEGTKVGRSVPLILTVFGVGVVHKCDFFYFWEFQTWRFSDTSLISQEFLRNPKC